MPTEQEVLNAIHHLAVMYLLYERKNETQLRIAFTALVQERHNQFHTNGSNKEGDGTSFENCTNEICRNSAAILKIEQKAEIELNDFSVQMMNENYVLRTMKSPGKCTIQLHEKSSVELTQPKSDLILKI